MLSFAKLVYNSYNMVELQNTPWNVGDVDTRDIYGSFLLLYMYAALDTDTHTRVVQTTTTSIPNKG